MAAEMWLIMPTGTCTSSADTTEQEQISIIWLSLSWVWFQGEITAKQNTSFLPCNLTGIWLERQRTPSTKSRVSTLPDLGLLDAIFVASFFPPLPEMPWRTGTWDAAFDSQRSPRPSPPDLAMEGSSLLRHSGERKGKLDSGVPAQILSLLPQKKEPSALISEGSQSVYRVNFFPRKSIIPS